jgi:regulator of sigma E protease
MLSIWYILLALLGLGFLILIHELGHYFMGKRVGMKVEVFSIGFGRPLRSWDWQGTKWQLCMLPFGGYVRFAGMEKKGNLEPYHIQGGFFNKSPLARIKVAIMGPVVNLAFALFLFSLIWIVGGRLQSFSLHTRIIGWVDPHSKLAEQGIKPGDQLDKMNGREISNVQELVYGAVLANGSAKLEIESIDYWNGQSRSVVLPLFEEPLSSLEQRVNEVHALSPANALIYERLPDQRENVLEQGSPMRQSGIKYGDRIVWADGEVVFSLAHLSAIVNQPRVLLTVKRGEEIFVVQSPRVSVMDLQLTLEEKNEIDDWRNEANLSTRVANLYFIPYRISGNCVIEKAWSYIDEYSRHRPIVCYSENCSAISQERALLPGDRILAVDGRMIDDISAFMKALQEHKVLMVVANQQNRHTPSWHNADQRFIDGIGWDQLRKMVGTIGTPEFLPAVGYLRFLSPVEPKALVDFPDSKNKNLWLQNQEKTSQELAKLGEEEKLIAQRALEIRQKKKRLGIILQDEQVRYNPNPLRLFTGAVVQTWHTFQGLITGSITPKAISGPVGMLQVMHFGWMVGVKEALYWLGLISLNLGIFNLLPIPVLDGGHICFSLWEAVTKKQIKMKTMERLVIPFIIILVALLVFTTYQDILRLFK